MLYHQACTNKLQMQWTGPKVIVQKNSDTNYVIEEISGKRRQTLVHVNLLKPYYDKAKVVAMTISQPDEEVSELDIPEI